MKKQSNFLIVLFVFALPLKASAGDFRQWITSFIVNEKSDGTIVPREKQVLEFKTRITGEFYVYNSKGERKENLLDNDPKTEELTLDPDKPNESSYTRFYSDDEFGPCTRSIKAGMDRLKSDAEFRSAIRDVFPFAKKIFISATVDRNGPEGSLTEISVKIFTASDSKAFYSRNDVRTDLTTHCKESVSRESRDKFVEYAHSHFPHLEGSETQVPPQAVSENGRKSLPSTLSTSDSNPLTTARSAK